MCVCGTAECEARRLEKERLREERLRQRADDRLQRRALPRAGVDVLQCTTPSSAGSRLNGWSESAEQAAASGSSRRGSGVMTDREGVTVSSSGCTGVTASTAVTRTPGIYTAVFLFVLSIVSVLVLVTVLAEFSF